MNTYECNTIRLEILYSSQFYDFSQIYDFWNFTPIFTDFLHMLLNFGHILLGTTLIVSDHCTLGRHAEIGSYLCYFFLYILGVEHN